MPGAPSPHVVVRSVVGRAAVNRETRVRFPTSTQHLSEECSSFSDKMAVLAKAVPLRGILREQGRSTLRANFSVGLDHVKKGKGDG